MCVVGPTLITAPLHPGLWCPGFWDRRHNKTGGVRLLKDVFESKIPGIKKAREKSYPNFDGSPWSYTEKGQANTGLPKMPASLDGVYPSGFEMCFGWAP